MLFYIFSFVSAQQSLDDVVYLKNGSIIRGTVIEQIMGKSIKIQTRDGNVFVYPIDNVEKITKETPVSNPSPGNTDLTTGAISLRAYIGTDITGGLGYGGGLAYLWIPSHSTTAYEFGLDFIYHESKDHYDENFGTRTEVVTLGVFAGRANWLWNFSRDKSSVYFITGLGFVVTSLNWVLIDDTGNSQGTGKELDNQDYTSAGNLFNFGAGWSSAGGFGVRLETPLLFLYSAGNATAFVPTVTFGIVYRF